MHRSATLRQIALVTKLQAIVRGYQVRSYARYVERAMEIRYQPSLTARC